MWISQLPINLVFYKRATGLSALLLCVAYVFIIKIKLSTTGKGIEQSWEIILKLQQSMSLQGVWWKPKCVELFQIAGL